MSETVQDGHYVGAVKANRRVDGLLLAETEYRPGLIVPAHAHETALVAVVLDGSMTEQRGRQAAHCEKGSLIFQPPDEPHSHRFHDGGGRCFILQLGTRWIDRMRDLGMTSPGAPLDVRRTKANWLAGQMYREFRMADAAAGLAIEGYALALLGELARSRTRAERGARPPWLVRAVELIHARFHEDLGMADVAAAAGVHATHFTRTFKEQYGCTPGEYVRRLRVEHARDQLLRTDRPLAEIALGAGFADQAHFSRVFKSIVGVSPGAFRKASRST